MLALLALVPTVPTLLVLRGHLPSWRLSLLTTAVLWGVAVTAITELLSLFSALTPAAVATSWTIVSLVATSTYARICRPIDWPPVVRCLRDMPTHSRIPLFLLTMVIAALGLIAIAAAPNTWDSMTYHLPRVEHWRQQQSVAHYPTHNLRQLWMNPWAEFAILHLMLLSGSDRLVNLVQWCSMLGSVLGVSLVAQRLGADQRGQVLAAVLAGTIPMGILQATSTQTNYLVAFWMVCLATFLLTANERPRTTWPWLGVGGSLGLAVLTKGTAYLFAAPLLALYGLSYLRRYPQRLGTLTLCLAVPVLLLNAGYYARNVVTFGAPLASGAEGVTVVANDAFTPDILLSNVLRNAALHLGPAAIAPVSSIHDWLGISLNDPRSTFGRTQFEAPLYLDVREDYAGNTLHILLIGLALLLFLVHRKEARQTWVYPVAIVGAFLLFCLYLRWQPWHSRLHLPLFVLWAPFVALVLAHHTRSFATYALALALVVATLPGVMFNVMRPLIGPRSVLTVSRTEQYFQARPDLTRSYQAVADQISASRCRHVGLVMGSNDYEYPLWALLHERGVRDARIEHVQVSNVSARPYPVERPDPCLIVRVAETGLRIDPFERVAH